MTVVRRPEPGEASDEELVLAAQRGEAAALSALMGRHQAGLFRQALALLGDREDAADAVQDTMLVVLSRLSELREPAAFRGWLFRVGRNNCLMLRRRDRELPVADIADHVERAGNVRVRSVEETVEALALRDWVMAGLDALSEPLRVTALLRYFGRPHGYAEIAAITGVPVGTVRSRLSQLKRILAERLLDEAFRVDGRPALASARWRARLVDAYGVFNVRGDPRPAVALFAPDLTLRSVDGAQVGGRDLLLSHLDEDGEVGVRYTVRDVVAGRGVVVADIGFVNPPRDPHHCPPGMTQVFYHRDGEVYLAVNRYVPRPAGARPDR